MSTIRDTIKIIAAAGIAAAGTDSLHRATQSDMQPDTVKVQVHYEAPRYNFSKINKIGVKMDNLRLAKYWLFMPKIDTIAFTKFVSNLPYLLGSDSLTLQEFVCISMCVYNETGGRFISLSERGTAPYFFERRNINGLNKMSYNTLYGNRRAGDYLKKIGVKADYDAWNGEVYPYHEPMWIQELSKNADYFKYAGKFIIQVTGYVNFKQFVQPLLANMEELTWKQFEDICKNDASVYLGAVKLYLTSNLSRWNNTMAKVNKQNPDWDAFGHLISGKAKYHNFAERCEFMYRKLLPFIESQQ